MSSTDTIPQSSPLDKPLHLLTEDDISQLTREDCRRFLKHKGMRRPSWNKSQAIQQVISLKKLLETPPDSESGDAVGAPKKLHIPRPVVPQSVNLAPDALENRSRDDSWVSVLAAEDSIPYPNQSVSDYSGDRLGHHIAVATSLDIDSVSFRIKEGTHGHAGQMTIFYCGKVNVYDDMPHEKAHRIMQFAASSFNSLMDSPSPSDGFATLRPYPCHPQSPSVKIGAGSSGTAFKTLHTGISHQQKEDSNISREDGASSRKASVQRYREKRKDRLKRKVGMPSYTGFDINVDPPQSRLPHATRSSSEDNLIRNGNILADLNERDEECC